ncbi:phosphotransferase family protein [Pseudopontixanthobacter vadosimaris]|uniref:phosphotransferase family protein n=1 Tax=Pseudopontixanthobacter vadosimaris TaxID=2726450 RepID=UPI0014737145|nr:phosphotransferase family protein [Pseudopontixanthobacter vadosimaris]
MGAVTDLERLSGGASMESWAFTYGEQNIVLRRMPVGMASEQGDAATPSAISLDAQADLIEIACKAGVSAPRVLARLTDEDGLGQGFMMVRSVGETLPRKIFGDPDLADAVSTLSEQCARELAAIHAIGLDRLPAEIRCIDAAALLDMQEKAYRTLQVALPAYDYAFRWLENNIPEVEQPKLLHADFRMGNLMVDKQGISAVLDWELAHIGDPMEDLAYLCTPSWRFGHYHREAGGFDSADNLIAAYERASGTRVDRNRFDWWLMYNTLWWGVTCLRMGHSYRDGTVHVLERTIIGRRSSEVETDLLLQFEQMDLAGGAPLVFGTPRLLPEHGEVEYAEILNALIEWNREKILPESQGHALFEARVANNALGIAQRHAAWGRQYAEQSAARLARLGLSNVDLCAALRGGSKAIDDRDVWDHLRHTALERLSIDQPGYAGLQVALENWTSR